LKLALEHVLDELRPQVKAAGFRPGKAPNNVIERELGHSRVQSEVVDHALQHSYSRALRDEKLPVIAPPQVTVEKFVPYTHLEYSVTVQLMPPVKLADYKKFKIKRQEVKVDPAEVDKVIEDLRRREATRLESDHAAKMGCEVNFDFDGTKDGKPVSGASGKGHVLMLGSGQFIPGFEEQMVGLKAGDEKSFDIRFPKDYHEKSLANEMVKFAVKVNSVTELVLPEVNEEFISNVSPFKNIDELRGDILLQLSDRQTEMAAKQHEKEVLDALVEGSKFKAPDALVKQELARMRQELEQNMSYSGLSLEKYLELSKKTQEQLDADMRPEAERRVGLAMLMTEVAKVEDIQVSAAELDAEIEHMKARYEDEVAQAQLDDPEVREDIYNHMIGSRTVAKLLEYAER